LKSSRNTIRVALIGIGNVASVFVQTLAAKKAAGIWHRTVGGYKTSDIEIVAAFDTDPRKIDKDLSKSIFEEPNVSPKFVDVDRTGITVDSGFDAETRSDLIAPKRSIDPKYFERRIFESKAEVAINLLPSGMNKTSLEYAKASLRAKCSFVNATPARLATNAPLARKFSTSHLLLVGDDLLSQFGGTAFHKGILEFMNRRGLKIKKSYQLDVGGGNETLRTMQEDVKQDKREIKTDAISGEIPYPFQTVAGTTDYVDYLGNNRTSYFWIQSGSLFDSDIKIDVYLRTNDGTNASNILLDVVRATAFSIKSRRFSKAQTICEYGFKNVNKPALLREAQENFVREFDVK
jgi:myo-inositol-1-phosphate synthase